MEPLTAEELYAQLVDAIDEALRAKNIYAVPAAAEAAGMTGGQTHKGFSERWEYSHRDEPGRTVLLNCRWYDQSKPFSIQPDKHIMSVELRGPNLMKAYSGTYEE